MNSDSSAEIIRKITALRKAVPRPDVFGAESHEFQFHPALPEKQASQFEDGHGILLPEDYRLFLTAIGNGGAGPGMGLFALGVMDDTEGYKSWSEGDGFIGILANPFPFSCAWNDLSGYPEEALLESDEVEYERQLEAFDRRYWNPRVMNGAFPICHLGCAMRVWLVVTGPERGNLWLDDRTSLKGISPVVLGDSTRTTFNKWYLHWLNDAFELIKK